MNAFQFFVLDSPVYVGRDVPVFNGILSILCIGFSSRPHCPPGLTPTEPLDFQFFVLDSTNLGSSIEDHGELYLSILCIGFTPTTYIMAYILSFNSFQFFVLDSPASLVIGMPGQNRDSMTFNSLYWILPWLRSTRKDRSKILTFNSLYWIQQNTVSDYMRM